MVEVVGSWSLAGRHLIGRVILAEVLSTSPERLVEYVREAEDSPLFGQIVGASSGDDKMIGLADMDFPNRDIPCNSRSSRPIGQKWISR